MPNCNNPTTDLVAVLDAETAALLNPETGTTEVRALVYTVAVVLVDLNSVLPLFDPETGLVAGGVQFLYLAPDVDEQRKLGRVEEEGTAIWWSEQSDNAIHCRDGGAVYDEEGREIVPAAVPISIYDLPAAISTFIRRAGVASVLSRGNDYDPPIIKNIFHELGEPLPVPHYAWQDVRTFINAHDRTAVKGHIPGNRRPAWLVAHSAFHDALWDAEQLRVITPVCTHGEISDE